MDMPQAVIVAPPDPRADDFARRFVDLAQPRLGSQVLAASDDFFAPKERLIAPPAPIFVPDKYDDNGKWMDGWESRRKRTPGHDWCIVKLGVPGRIQAVDIDTSHFTGNYPPEASLEACRAADDELEGADWRELVPRVALEGNAHHVVETDGATAWTHVRLNIFPDGGVARLRLYGEIERDWSSVGAKEVIDLVALENGGKALAWNDAHFGRPENLLAPDKGLNMGDGWETRRRREAGNDWCVLALGHPGTIEEILVDTAFFKGNYPDRCSIQAALIDSPGSDDVAAASEHWPALLGEQKLQADREHRFLEQLADIGPVSHVRLNIFPDGGVSRLRLYGRIHKGTD